MTTASSSTAVDSVKRYGSTTAFLVIGALVLCKWLLSPHMNYLHAVERLGPVVAQIAEERERICGTRAEKRTELLRLQRELAEADRRFFKDDEAKAFLRGLLPLIEETGSTIASADFTGGEESQTVADANEPVAVVTRLVNLRLLGLHDQVVALVGRLQSHEPTVWIDACRIAVLDERSARLECDLTLKMHIIRERQRSGAQ